MLSSFEYHPICRCREGRALVKARSITSVPRTSYSPLHVVRSSRINKRRSTAMASIYAAQPVAKAHARCTFCGAAFKCAAAARLSPVAQRRQNHEGVARSQAQDAAAWAFLSRKYDNSSCCSAFAGDPMENFLSALAFAGLIAAQFLAVVLVSTQRCDNPFPGPRNRKTPRAGQQRHFFRPRTSPRMA